MPEKEPKTKSFLDFEKRFNNMHLLTTMAPWQSGLLYGSAKPWFVGSNPTGALMFLSYEPRDHSL